jgi:hypothetical protein
MSKKDLHTNAQNLPIQSAIGSELIRPELYLEVLSSTLGWLRL